MVENETKIFQKEITWCLNGLNMQDQKICISGLMLKEKALEIVQSLRIKDFWASNGWLKSFKVQHISFLEVCGKSVDVNNDDCGKD